MLKGHFCKNCDTVTPSRNLNSLKTVFNEETEKEEEKTEIIKICVDCGLEKE